MTETLPEPTGPPVPVHDIRVVDDPNLLPSQRGAPSGRLVVVERLAFRQGNQQPVGWNWEETAPVSSQDKPYSRQLKVGPQWVPLDYGWLVREDGTVSPLCLVTLKNDEGKFEAVLPTQDERDRVASLVVELAVMPPSLSDNKPRTMHSPKLLQVVPVVFSDIPPGRSCRISNPPEGTLVVRCVTGLARLTQTLFPG